MGINGLAYNKNSHLKCTFLCYILTGFLGGIARVRPWRIRTRQSPQASGHQLRLESQLCPFIVVIWGKFLTTQGHYFLLLNGDDNDVLLVLKETVPAL